MIGIVTRIINKLKFSFRHYHHLNGLGSFLNIFDALFKIDAIRKVYVNGTAIYLRSNTHDQDIAISCLLNGEFGNIKCDNPHVIIDAGANIGAASLYFANKYPEAKIIAIEPEKSNFEILQKNISTYSNIKAIQAALWSSADKRTIQNRHTGHIGYTITDTDNECESTGQDIDCLSIESLQDEYGLSKIDILKIDIEGSEKEVFKAASSWIDDVDIVNVELHDRITAGCSEAFYQATKGFKQFDTHGEKITAYRNEI